MTIRIIGHSCDRHNNIPLDERFVTPFEERFELLRNVSLEPLSAFEPFRR